MTTSPTNSSTTVGDVMHAGAQCIGENQNLCDAAQLMDELNVGALPICGEEERLIGMCTDRDIIIKCVAAGKDPAKTTAGELATGSVIWVDDSANIMDAITLMEQHRVRRLPVIDSNKRLVGMLAQADIAGSLGHEVTGELVDVISSSPSLQHA